MVSVVVVVSVVSVVSVVPVVLVVDVVDVVDVVLVVDVDVFVEPFTKLIASLTSFDTSASMSLTF